jgi:RNA polymerase subunit RPABC4/transcription elongation factor Spt4
VLQGVTTLDEIARMVYMGRDAVRACPSCRTPLGTEHDYCAACGTFVGDHCQSCHRRVQPGWQFCAFCGESARTESRGHARNTGGPRVVPKLRKVS